jgi:hypothetical protein
MICPFCASDEIGWMPEHRYDVLTRSVFALIPALSGERKGVVTVPMYQCGACDRVFWAEE